MFIVHSRVRSQTLTAIMAQPVTIIRSFVWLVMCTVAFMLGCTSISPCLMKSFIPLFLIMSGLIGVIFSILDITTNHATHGYRPSLTGYLTECFRLMHPPFYISIIVWNLTGTFYITSIIVNKYEGITYIGYCRDIIFYVFLYLILFWIAYFSGMVVKYCAKRNNIRDKKLEQYCRVETNAENTPLTTAYVLYDS